MAKVRVRHSYSFRTGGMSDYGRATAIVKALEPLNMNADYGYVDDKAEKEVTIWWETMEEVGFA